MAVRREFVNSPILQGVDEKWAYTVDTSRWPGTGAVTGVVVAMKDSAGANAPAKLSGAASVAGDIITTPLVIDMVDGVRFRLEVLWVKSGNTPEAWGHIDGET